MYEHYLWDFFILLLLYIGIKWKFSFSQIILKMICALLAMIFESLGVYEEEKFEWGPFSI